MDVDADVVPDLTEAEQSLIVDLPRPPLTAPISTTNVWIVEWLPSGDRGTGRELFEWMQGFRPGWAVYTPCGTKEEVIATLGRIKERAEAEGRRPVLHLEAHGSDAGLVGPKQGIGEELLTWKELCEPLQQVNVATKCNLVVFLAACSGFAGSKVFTAGPRSPAAALVGPTGKVLEGELLGGAKEFYRRVMDDDARMEFIVNSASNELKSGPFEWDPFIDMAYSGFVENIVVGTRPAEVAKRRERLRHRMQTETTYAAEEIERRLASLSAFPAEHYQEIWDELFMIDLYPENQARFGLDVRALVAQVSRARQLLSS